MSKPDRRWWYVLETEHASNHTPSALLDMLRYDGARVEQQVVVGGTPYWLLSKLEQGGYPPPNLERWLSFGITVTIVFRSALGPSLDQIAEVLRRCRSPHDHVAEVLSSHVGRPYEEICTGLTGYVSLADVGKRVFVRDGVTQIESAEQRDARMAR